MARLPIPGSDSGKWGEILNEYLSQSHDAAGNIKAGAVTKSDVGLGNVDNTSDNAKPISIAQQAALDAKLAASALDSQTAAKIQDGNSATASALSASIAANAKDAAGRRLDEFEAISADEATVKYGGKGRYIAWLGDSLTANGSTPTLTLCSLASSASIGATSLSVNGLYAGNPAYSDPLAGYAYVIDEGTASEEWVSPTAVTGTNPYTFTVPVLAKAHTAGAAMRPVPRYFSARSVPMWTALLSSSRLRFGGVFAHGGWTTTQIRDVYLPLVLAQDPKPVACVVNVATNDGWSISSAMPVALDIIDQLIDNGILPIVTAAPPRGGSLVSATIGPIRWNHRMAEECAERGIPFVDSHAVLSDDGSGVAGSGNYLTRYNYDNTHPSEIGAKAWAQAIVDAVGSSSRVVASVNTPTVNNYSGDAVVFPGGTQASNILMLTDTNADGIPDGWSKNQGNAGDTVALVTEPGVKGKMFKVTRVDNGTTDPIYLSGNLTINSQERYRAIVQIKTTGVDAAYDALASTTGTGGGNTSSNFAGFDLRLTAGATHDDLVSIKTWQRELPLSTLIFDFVAPKLSSGTSQWTLQLRGGATTPSYSVQVQTFLVNLTQAGMA